MPGTHPLQYFGWGDVNGNIPTNIITVIILVRIFPLTSPPTKILEGMCPRHPRWRWRQCLQCVTPPWRMLRYCDRARSHWTEQWRRDQAGRHPLQNRTEFINFSENILINRQLQFLFAYSFSNWLAVSCLPFEKLLLNVRICKWHVWWRQVWRHLHVTVLTFWAKFSFKCVNTLSVWMIHAKKLRNSV